MSVLSEWCIGIFLIAILILSVGANGLAVLVLVKRPTLRTISNRFVTNLLVCNLLCCFLLGPAVAISNHFPRLVYIPCALAEGCTAFCTMATAMAVLLIATDQFIAVTDPLHYHTKMTNALSIIMVIIQWSISFIFALSVSLLPNIKPSVWSFCSADQENFTPSFDNFRIAYASTFLIFFVISLLVTFSMFICISVAARKSAKPPALPPAILGKQNATKLDSREESVGLSMSCDKKSIESDGNCNDITSNIEMGQIYEADLARSLRSVLLDISKPYPVPFCLKLTHDDERKRLSHNDIYKITTIVPTHTAGLKTVRSSPNFGVTIDCRPQTPPPRCSSSYMTSLRCRISNASLFKYKEESRATRISLIVIFLTIFFQTPAALLQVIPDFGLVPIYLLFIGSSTFPFVFAYRNTRIQEELYRMCGRRNSSDVTPFSQSLRRASSLSTERSWRICRNNSPSQHWNIFRVSISEQQTVPDLLTCPPGKSILKRVRAQSKMWGRKSKTCKFYQEPPPIIVKNEAVIRRNSLDNVANNKTSIENIVLSSKDNVDGVEFVKNVR